MSNSQKILIVEDEVFSAENLKTQLEKYGYKNGIICRRDEEALLEVEKQKFDLALIDIALTDSLLDGVELGKVLSEQKKIPIIYITAYSNKSIIQRAEETNPYNYLVKPVSPRQLFTSIERIFNTPKKRNQDEAFKTIRTDQDSIWLKINGEFQRLLIRDICWIESYEKKILICTETDKITYTLTLSSFARKVNHPLLIQVHQKYIVNYAKANRLNLAEMEFYIHRNSKEIPILLGKKYKNNFLEKINRLRTD